MAMPEGPSPFHRAMQTHQSGKLAEAEAMYRTILRAEPRHADALHLLGVLHCQKGEIEAGRDLISKAIAIKPSASFHLNLFNALNQLGRAAEALAALRKSADLNPADLNVAVLLADEMRKRGDLVGALTQCRKTIDTRPKFARAHNILGLVYQGLGRLEEATGALRVAVDLEPAFAEAHNNLGVVLMERGKLEEALASYRTAADHNPQLADIQGNIGSALQELGRADEALAALRLAVARNPDSFACRWRLVNGHLRPIYAAEGDIETCRAAYIAALEELARETASWNQAKLAAAADGVGGTQPYYLAYQGKIDREPQRIYGDMIARILRARFPTHAHGPAARPLTPGVKIRVGFASAYFVRHSNWKIPIKGWIENLDRDRFEIYLYHLSAWDDPTINKGALRAARFDSGPRTLAQWADAIAGDRLDVLIYPEVGMFPLTLNLAALRLAPVQASSWGHPQTSGLPSIDYYLSSDLMEGPDADAHYTERLVRLPHLSIFYEPPEHTPADIARKDIGVPDAAVIYWCCQSLFKYLPRHDALFARIARRVPDARFVFIRHQQGEHVTRAMQERLARAFGGEGLDATTHCIFLPKLSFEQFSAASRLADVYLDSIEWSGCNSLLESLHWNTPPVILPGPLMRGRHAVAIMAMMGVMETVADSADDYVEIAVRLGTDSAFRAAVSARIAANKHRLYRDIASVRGLEEFLTGAVEHGLDGYALPGRSKLAVEIDGQIARQPAG
jgi:predicted O-linked N-acetylglucosamine transferase (SPINDLY family)